MNHSKLVSIVCVEQVIRCLPVWFNQIFGGKLSERGWRDQIKSEWKEKHAINE